MTALSWADEVSHAQWESLARAHRTPFYAYDAGTLGARCRAVRAAFGADVAVRYAMKANACGAVLDALKAQGAGIDAVSAWEVRFALERGFSPGEVLYTGSFPSDEELESVARAGVVANLDALSAIERYGRIAPGAKVSIRVDLEEGAGHHPHVVTAGVDSKFGLPIEQLDEALAIVEARGLSLQGLHQHIGSGLLTDEHRDLWVRAAAGLFSLARRVESARGPLAFVDVGGGFGVAYRAEERPVDLAAWGEALANERSRAWPDPARRPTLCVEPGRYLVAEAGVLVARVTTVKRGRDRVWVGTDAGMHSLVRPAMYGSYHPVRNARARDGLLERCFIVGPICESGDVLAEDRAMVVPEEGDLLVIGVAGAYGYAMASTYNLRPRPAEWLRDGDAWRLARESDRYESVVR